MKKDTRSTRRVMLALNETSALQVLWRAAIQQLTDEQAELVTVFIRDDRWRRAASLPFTVEVSRSSGGRTDFTLQRAEEVDRDVVLRTQSRLQQLATDFKVQLVFETLAEHEATRIHEFVRSESDVLIAPSLFKRLSFYGELSRMKCQILLVDEEDATSGPEDE